MQFAGGDLPVNGVATASQAILVGWTEYGTASAFVLPTPYPGAQVIVQQDGSATANHTFVTDATAVLLNNTGNTTITLNYEGEGFHLVGSSATRWRIYSMNNPASIGTALS